jgi:ankyrin repeat protein
LPKATGFNFNYYRPLQLALLKGDWESTKAFIDFDPSALTAKITIHDQTALHVAAMGAQWKVVEKLAQVMPANMFVEKDSRGRTCLHYVAIGKSADTAKALVAKNSSATQIDDSEGLTPICYSIAYNTLFKEMTWFLVLNTLDDRPASACPFSTPSAIDLLGLLTTVGFHGN